MIQAQSVTDVTGVSQELVRGLEIGSLLTLEINPLWGYVFILVGLALCLAGYFLYRLMVILAVAVAGGAVVFLFAPGFVDLTGTALWTSAAGAALVLGVVGWFLYPVAVFMLGAVAGLSLGVSLWLVGSGRFADLAGLTSGIVARDDLPAIVATALLPAIAIGVVMVSWERRLITLVSVVLGAAVLALGLRYIQLPEAVVDWSPVAAGAAMALGLYLNSRPRRREAD